MGDTGRVKAPTTPDVFYPIVPDIAWLKRIVPLGVRTVQLRLKDASRSVIHDQISEGIAICQDHGCQFIVNDHWRAAIDLGAADLHLGQEDLAAADLKAIQDAGIRLGIS
ncbi:MAG: thiamine phosphate synthase, partial [Pseudomonadota bacterium]